MPIDPYGFPDSAFPDRAAAPTIGQPALVSLYTGIAALGCGAIGPCLCYAPWFVALPLSAVSVWSGIQAKRAGSADKGLDHASTAGLVAGSIALSLSLLWVGLVVVYGVMLVAIIAADM